MRSSAGVSTARVAVSSGGSSFTMATIVSAAGGFLYLRAMDDSPPKRILGGGTMVRLCEAAVPAGAAWGSDGFIYFAPTNNSGLSTVAEAGGQPEQVTTLDRSLGEISHRFPQALPDGTGLLIPVWRGKRPPLPARHYWQRLIT